MKQIKGTELSPEEQRHALRAFVYRFTKEHKPAWVKDENVTPVQFASDRDWLEHTLFWVTKDGKLSNRHRHCYSTPTWPNGVSLMAHLVTLYKMPSAKGGTK